MDRDAFTKELGLRQGRVAPAGVAPLAGSYAVCLGWDGPTHSEEVEPGSFVQVEQSAAFTPGTKVFSVGVYLRPPASIPTGHKWVLQLLVDDVVIVEQRLLAGGQLVRRTLSANVSKYSAGAHIVTLRLRFLTDDTTQYIALANFECGP